MIPTVDRPFARSRDTVSREAYGRVVDKVFTSILHESDEVQGQRLDAPELFAELSALAPTQQALVIRNSPRYQVWGLAETLLARSCQEWAENPALAEDLASLAVEVTENLVAEGFRKRLLNDLKAEAWSYIGNCKRIRSDLRGARRAFDRAEKYLREGSADPLEEARLVDLKSSLERASRNFSLAEELLGRAIIAYRASADRHMEGRALLKLAKLMRDSGRIEGSIPLIERAGKLIDREREPRLDLSLKLNLISHLIVLSRLDEAGCLLPQVREVARRHGSHLDRLRVLWVEGNLRKLLGQVELAEEALTHVREGFIAADIAYDVALVSLDLASLFLESGRTSDVRELAVESLSLFASRGIHREVIMAWSLFREAAERESVSLGLLQRVAAAIRQAPTRASEATEGS